MMESLVAGLKTKRGDGLDVTGVFDECPLYSCYLRVRVVKPSSPRYLPDTAKHSTRPHKGQSVCVSELRVQCR